MPSLQLGEDISRIILTGGAGFLGRHVEQAFGGEAIVLKRPQYDLIRTNNLVEFLKADDIVIHMAAKVGGIGFNQKNPGLLIHDNTLIGLNVLNACVVKNVKKVILLGTVCAYPAKPPNIPFIELDLFSGYPEPTNAPYGIAKRWLLAAAIAYAKEYNLRFNYLIPTNMYGPGDNFKDESSHVIPALIKKIDRAKMNNEPYIEVWGDGSASREFLYVKDAAEAIKRAAFSKNAPIIPMNLGSGKETTIKELTGLLCGLMGYEGEIRWDKKKPNGQKRRVLDVSRAKQVLDWEATTTLEEGLKATIAWYEMQKLTHETFSRI